jgi:hypothetical protein
MSEQHAMLLLSLVALSGTGAASFLKAAATASR